jgi:hypothetical protein
MIARCEDPNNNRFFLYGGRGIRVCERWRSSFAAFREDMGEPPQRGMSLDRIDSEGNYEPTNCRWATAKQQQRNRRNNHTFEYNGERLTVTEWAERTGIAMSALLKRRSLGWSVERTLTEPSVVGRRRKCARVESVELVEPAKAGGER